MAPIYHANSESDSEFAGFLVTADPTCGVGIWQKAAYGVGIWQEEATAAGR
jgi:hypothetical protein